APVDGADDVAARQPGAFRRGVFADLADDDAASGGGKVELSRRFGREGDGAHAQVAAPDIAIGDQTLRNAARDGRRDREAQPDAAPRGARGADGRVDADDLALQVDQRAAGVARVDRGVGLDERLEPVVAQDALLAPDRADDPRGDGLLEP